LDEDGSEFTGEWSLTGTLSLSPRLTKNGVEKKHYTKATVVIEIGLLAL